MSFDPNHSPLERDSDKITAFIDIIEAAFDKSVRVVGIVEIGSYAKGEAVPESDTDTRVYLACPDATYANVIGNHDKSLGLTDYITETSAPEPVYHEWYGFNVPVRQKIRDALQDNISFGFIDVGYADYLFERFDRYQTGDHSMLFQSNVIYDPEQWIARWRTRLDGITYDSLVAFYKQRVLWRTRERLQNCLDDPPRRVLWASEAVRSIRDAVSLRTYAETGHYIFKKPEVFRFIEGAVPQHNLFIHTLYQWKCDPEIRRKQRQAISDGDQSWLARYGELMPQVKTVVEDLVVKVV